MGKVYQKILYNKYGESQKQYLLLNIPPTLEKMLIFLMGKVPASKHAKYMH